MKNMTKDYKDALVAMRRHLHQFPETAHNEEKTAAYLLDFFKQFNPDRIVHGIGGNGIAVIYNGKEEGPAIMIRSELDALPITEINRLDYISANPGKGHLCGHDGHMTMVAGLAPLLSVSRPESGSVILLFQPAEETGEGAGLVLKDEKFESLSPDYVFALHNLPGYDYASIITRKGVFASASRGLIFELKGTSSHAGHPEGGNNPAVAAAQLIESVMAIPQKHIPMHKAALITPIHMRVGQPAFGTSPGEGVVMFTIRAHSNETMELMEKEILHLVKHTCRAHRLSFEYRWTEPFEAVMNDADSVDLIEKCAHDLELEVVEADIPFPWSEDFGVFTGKYKGALFGLGSGKSTPQLHNENFDFPDRILDKGTMMFWRIIDELLNT